MHAVYCFQNVINSSDFSGVSAESLLPVVRSNALEIRNQRSSVSFTLILRNGVELPTTMLPTTITIQSMLFLLVSCAVALEDKHALIQYRDVWGGIGTEIMCRVSTDEEIALGTDSLITEIPVIWLKYDLKDPSNHVIISHGNTVMVDDPRVSVTNGFDWRKTMLVYDRFEESDEGRYQCQLPIDVPGVPIFPITEILVHRKTDNITEKPVDSSQSAPMLAVNVLLLVALNFINCATKLFYI